MILDKMQKIIFIIEKIQKYRKCPALLETQRFGVDRWRETDHLTQLGFLKSVRSFK